MPPKTSGSTSKLLARYGNRMRQAHDAHKNDEMKVNDFSSLPPGLKDAVAVLESCGFREIPSGRENAGEFEFYAVGVMVEPFDHTYEEPAGSGHSKTVKVAGKQTRYREVMADTPKAQGKKKTFDDHYASILNEMRKLGYDTTGLSVDHLEAAAADITKARPYFKVRTSLLPAMEGQEPRVYESWDGPVEEGYEPPEMAGTEVDNTATPTARPSNNGATKTAPASEGPPEDLEFGDLDSLLELANKNDSSKASADAQDKLTQMALAAGKSQEEIEDDDTTWDMVADWIREGDQSGEDDAAEEPEAPQKGEVWRTRLVVNGKKSNKMTDVEIMTVYPNKQSADVKSLVDKKVHKSVPFADLVPSE